MSYNSIKERVKNERFKKCQKALKAKGYDPVFISLYGSQNYNCDTKDADIRRLHF